jgi:hypothetical protein
MRQSQLPLLGLFLALLVGARVGTPGGAPEAGPAASLAQQSVSSSSQPAEEDAAPVTGRKHASSVVEGPTGAGLVENGCDEVTETSKAGSKHIFRSLRTSPECLPALPPVYRILCRLNPHYSSSNDIRHQYQLQELKADKPQLPNCLMGLSAAEKPQILLVMASVPDPKHSHLGLLTDRTVEAIQVAASKYGYNPYSHFLPWPLPDSQKNAEAVSAAEGEGASRDPGVLVFRRQDSPLPQPSPPIPPQYLVVFLIPELPTGGLNQEYFSTAKSIMDQVSAQLGQTKQQNMPFAGPNFSGSLASLKDLDRQLGATQCIHAFSGQVTAAKYFNQKKGPDDKDVCASQLVLTQTPDCAAIPLFVKSMRDYYRYPADEIALLSEGGTAYGNEAAKMGVSKGETGTASGRPANVDPRCFDVASETGISDVLNLRFPRDISKVRNAYGALTTPASPTGSSSQQDTDLQLSWRDSQATRGDDLPTYGGAQTPFSQDAVLSSLAIALKVRQIKALGILATDPMDVAFLIRSFRKSSPDVRLFLRDPDLLYLRTPDVGSLNGTLLVSNHPMILRNQLWSSDAADNDNEKDKDNDNEKDNAAGNDSPGNKPAKNDRKIESLMTLSSAGQEAQYDAFLLLLGEFDTPPNGIPPRLEWNWPAGRTPPPGATVSPDDMSPLWLTTIGTTGQFPLAVLSPRPSLNDSDFDLQTLDVGGPRFTGKVLWMMVAMLGIAHVLGLSFPNALPRLLRDDFDLGDASDTITASKAVCHVAILLILAVIQLVMGSSYVFFRDLNSSYAWMGWSVIGVTIILSATACLVFLIRVAWPWRQAGSEEASLRNAEISGLLRPLVGGVSCFAIFGLIGALWGYGVFRAEFSAAFLHYRDLILASGVAPFIPIVLLLVVAYFGAWAYLRRLTYWGYRRPQMPSLPLDDIFPSDFTKQITGIDKCVLVLLENRGWMLALVFLSALGIFGFSPWANMDMTEARSVRWSAQFLFAVAFFALSLNWFRFLNIWSLLRHILDGLERLPIRHAFERMPSEKSMPIWRWGISDNSFLPTTQAIERLRALELADASVVDPLVVEDLKSKIREVGGYQPRRLGIWGILLMLWRQQQPGLIDPGQVESRTVELPEAVGQSRTEVVEDGRTSSRWQQKQQPGPVEVPKAVDESRTKAVANTQSGSIAESVPDRLGELLFAARDAMLRVVNQLIYFLSAENYWRRGSDGSREKKGRPEPELRTFVLAEDLIAMRYYTYIRYVVVELRNLLFFVALAFSLLFLAFHTYAFRADQAIDWSFLVLFLILGAGVTVVLYQMELDPILSHFAGRKAGKVGWSFYLNLLKYGAVPFLTIIGSQVPAVSNLLLRWVQPTLQSLR